MQASESANATPREAISGLSQSFERTFDQNRMLWSEMARFTKDESLRFVQQQLDHANHAFARFEDRRDFPALIGAQQEWLKDVVQDCATQSLRYAEMFRALTGRVRENAEQVASDIGAQGRETMKDLNKAGEKAARQSQQAAE